MAELTVGPVVTNLDVELAVRDTLKASVPYYLARMDEQYDVDGETTPPRLYVARSDNERWAEETPPVLVVACPGFAGTPDRHNQRASYGAWFQVNIGVTVGGATEDGSRALASRHLGAIMLTVAQQPTMGGLADDSRLIDGRPDTIGPQRTLMGCEVVAHIHVARIVDTRGLIPRDLPDPTDTTPVGVTPVPTGLRVRVTPTE